MRDVPDELASSVILENKCPRPTCQGAIMSETICEHMIIRTCPACAYEYKTIDGESKLAFAVAIGGSRITRSHR